MSKPVAVYAGSSRPCSPASPASGLLAASRCLTASRIAPPVHGISTTRVTTAKLPSTPAGQPGRRSGAPHPHSVPRIRDQRIWPCGITAGTIANVCPAAQIAEYALLNQHSAGRPGCAQINLSVLVLARELPLGACRKGIVLRDRRHRAPLALRTWRCPETVRSSHEISCAVWRASRRIARVRSAQPVPRRARSRPW